MFARCFLLLALTASLWVGCSKGGSQDLGTPKTVALGTVELTYGTPTRQDLGDKVTCVLSAQPLSAGNMELVVALEKAGKQVAITRASPAPIDQPLHLVLRGYTIDLTPHVK